MLQAVGSTEWGDFVARRVPDQRDQRQGDQPDDAHHDDEQGVLADLVHLQRAEPDRPDAEGVGPDRLRPERLHRHGERLQGGVHLPRQPVQGHVELGELPAVERRGRPVQAAELQPGRQRDLRAEQVLLRPGEANPVAVQGGAVHHGGGRVQRAPLGQRQPEAERRLPADHRRPEEAGERHGRRQPGARLHARPAVLVGHQLLRAQHRTPPPPRARSSSSCTSGRRWRTWSTRRRSSPARCAGTAS